MHRKGQVGGWRKPEFVGSLALRFGFINLSRNWGGEALSRTETDFLLLISVLFGS